MIKYPKVVSSFAVMTAADVASFIFSNTFSGELQPANQELSVESYVHFFTSLNPDSMNILRHH